jgi:glycerol-3-phosphate acyltransferase PlsY
VSLGSILASISVPLMMLVLHKPLPIFLFGLIGAAVVLYRHKTNIVRLYQGTESKIGQKPDDGGVK